MLTLLEQGQASKLISVPNQRAVTASGAYADVGPDDAVRVYSERKELVFEYDPGSGRTRLYVPKGDLELVAAQGDIRLVAAGNVRMYGRSVLISASQSLKLAIHATAGKFRSMMSFDRRSVRVEGEHLERVGKTATSKLRSSVLEGDRCETKMRDISIAANRMETNADCIVENAGSVFRSVRDLLQQTAGRMKSIVNSMYQMRCENAFMKADKDFKIDGDQVHLG